MKEVGIRWCDMTNGHRDSILVLKTWIHQMWSVNGIRDYYRLHMWLFEIINKNILLSTSDLAVLKELWNVYCDYRKLKIEL